jgi:bis(5'-nucleosyl)-tetraphosphatase (symmetrical)
MESKNYSRTLCFGDIHGCLDECKTLLDKVNYDPATDRVCLLGDLVDRGPYSAAVVRFARLNGFEAVVGNHDEKYVRYWRHEQRRAKNQGLINPMTKFAESETKMEVFNSLNEEDLHFLSQLSPYISLDEHTVLVHAGLMPGVPLQRQRFEVMTHIRYLDRDTNKMLPIRPDFSQPPNSYFWSEKWSGAQSVIYGHNVHSLTDVKIDEPSPGVRCYGIDTGVCFGGRLSCLIYPAMEIVQIQAKREYYRADTRK